MQVRAATEADVPRVAELQARCDRHWFGAEEHSLDEVREYFGYTRSLADDSLLVLIGNHLIGAAFRWGADTALLADPAVDPAPVHDVVLPWFAARPGCLEVLSADAVLRSRVEACGWTYQKSAFDLLRRVTADWRLDDPVWPHGIHRGRLESTTPAAVHQLIYREAGWADIPDHPDRDLPSWQAIFLANVDGNQQVLAWRGDRLVGVALGRIWDDGTGWVSQLATARAERRKGLGRALLLESLRGHVENGATALGLTVQAANDTALQLYLGVGLRVQREWRTYFASDAHPAE
jgi:ribosomal protein S18 acetylase RimI-like enzyme